MDEFTVLAQHLEAALPQRQDPSHPDDDFGHFIDAAHVCSGSAPRPEDHCARAVLCQTTQRFSMEFYILPFLNRWPEETLAQLNSRMRDGNYNVRRLMREGT